METKTREELLTVYEKVGPFIEGLAQAYKDGKWFHVKRDGTPAYEKRYDWVGNMNNGVARAQMGVAEILINTKGEQTFLN